MCMIPEADLYCHQVAGLDCPDHCGDLQPPSSPPAPRYHRNRGSRSRYPAPKYKKKVLSLCPLHTLEIEESLRKIFYFVLYTFPIRSALE